MFKKIIEKYLIFLVLLFLFTTSNGQIKSNSLGVRIGYTKISYYDETINYKIYNGFAINPYQIRFTRNSNKNTYIANLLYISNTVNPIRHDNLVRNDHINIRFGLLDFTYLRQIFSYSEKLNFRIGSKLSANFYDSYRFCEGAYSSMLDNSSYEITFSSLCASGQIKYTISEKSCFTLNFDFPFLALNLKNYNSRSALFEPELWLVSMNKYAGFTSDLAFVKKFNRFSFEIFQAIYFIKYKEPYSKRVLTNKVGIGLYYEF